MRGYNDLSFFRTLNFTEGMKFYARLVTPSGCGVPSYGGGAGAAKAAPAQASIDAYIDRNF